MAKPTPANGERRVLLLCSTVLPHRRRVVGGVIEHARERAGWELEHLADAGELAWNWAVDGVAGAVVEAGQYDAAVRARLTGMPVVLAGHEPPDGRADAPRVQVDDAAMAALAFAHLAEGGGLRSIGHVGPVGVAFNDERERALRHSAGAAGVLFDGFDTKAGSPQAAAGHARLETWLRDLPIPTGVLTAGQPVGRTVVGAARHAGLAVPEDVAVVAEGEDELLCRLCVPALSAIDPNGRLLGRTAAATLGRLLDGDRDVPSVQRVPPADLIVRRSSDALRVGHAGVREAVRLIRERATSGLTAADVLAHTTVPRRTLEVAFKRHLGRTIYEEITRARVEHAKRLLRLDAESITDVALDSGFGSGGSFAEVFGRVVGETPRAYRARHRPA